MKLQDLCEKEYRITKAITGEPCCNFHGECNYQINNVKLKIELWSSKNGVSYSYKPLCQYYHQKWKEKK